MAIGREATVDGSVIVAHSDDDVADERVIFVPAAHYENPKKTPRPVYYDDASLGHKKFEYAGEDGRGDKELVYYNDTELRRYIGTHRGPGYYPQDGETFEPSKTLGYIDQVEDTYAYFDSNYGVMNEHQLTIGECTCGAKVHPSPDQHKRIFYASELSRVALERCTKAREAIELMGDLIAEHGLYGTGETLIVGDTEEAWVMEMCAYDPDGRDGIWVAQRVPDNGLFAAANEFRIREVGDDPDEFMHSKNLRGVCEAKGWVKPGAKIDWLRAVSWGEYGHPYYSLRRVWRVLSKAAPALNLPAWVDGGYTAAYPFAVEPEERLSVAGVASLYRDHYEGTEFDLTRGLGAGPFGDPTRYEGNADRGSGDDDNPDTENTSFNLAKYHTHGAWERAVSIFRCGMFWINQARGSYPDPVGGISWIGLDRPAANCLMPFFVGVSELPASLETMRLDEFAFDGPSAWWAFNFVGNYATMRYALMINDIRKKQRELENDAYKAVQMFDGDTSIDDLTHFCSRHAGHVAGEWWDLARTLIVKYNDGCITDENGIMQVVGYPNRAWLKAAGFYDGPTEY
jgi:dipeptidase